jgi:hypothetical protein
VITAAQVALLSELGIVAWRARPGQAFPGAGLQNVDEEDSVNAESEAVAVDASVALVMDAAADLVLLADTHSEAEVEQLARIIQAVHGLRAGLHIEQYALDAQPPSAHALLRLDDVSFPSPATMLAQPSSKRLLWLALQDIVARLP